MQHPIVLIAVAALGVAGWAVARQRRQQQLAATPTALARPLQTWEGEGGGLPSGGPGQTVRPTLPASDAAVYADAAEREDSA